MPNTTPPDIHALYHDAMTSGGISELTADEVRTRVLHALESRAQREAAHAGPESIPQDPAVLAKVCEILKRRGFPEYQDYQPADAEQLERAVADVEAGRVRNLEDVIRDLRDGTLQVVGPHPAAPPVPSLVGGEQETKDWPDEPGEWLSELSGDWAYEATAERDSQGDLILINEHGWRVCKTKAGHESAHADAWNSCRKWRRVPSQAGEVEARENVNEILSAALGQHTELLAATAELIALRGQLEEAKESLRWHKGALDDLKYTAGINVKAILDKDGRIESLEKQLEYMHRVSLDSQDEKRDLTARLVVADLASPARKDGT